MTNTAIPPSSYNNYVSCLPSVFAFVNISLLNVQSGYTSRSKMPDIACISNVTSRTMAMYNSNIRSQLQAIDSVKIGYNHYNLSCSLSTKALHRASNFAKLNFTSDIRYIFSSQHSLDFELSPLDVILGKNIVKYLNNGYTSDPQYAGIYGHYRLVDRLSTALNDGSVFLYAPPHEHVEQFQSAHFASMRDYRIAVLNVQEARYNMTIPESIHSVLLADYPHLVSTNSDCIVKLTARHSAPSAYHTLNEYLSHSMHSSTNGVVTVMLFNLRCSDEILLQIKNMLSTGNVNNVSAGMNHENIRALEYLRHLYVLSEKYVLIFSYISENEKFAFIASNIKLESFADIFLGFSLNYKSSLNQTAFLHPELLSNAMRFSSQHILDLIVSNENRHE